MPFLSYGTMSINCSFLITYTLFYNTDTFNCSQTKSVRVLQWLSFHTDCIPNISQILFLGGSHAPSALPSFCSNRALSFSLVLLLPAKCGGLLFWCLLISFCLQQMPRWFGFITLLRCICAFAKPPTLAASPQTKPV